MRLLKKLIVIGFALGALGYYALSEWAGASVSALGSTPPPLGVTGAPNEGTCAGCHFRSFFGDQDQTNTNSAGSIKIMGLPAAYTPGQTYPVTVTLSLPAAIRWGFALTAIDSNGTSSTVGSFTITDSENTISRFDSFLNRTYISHTGVGTFPGQPHSASWSFNWKAPSSNIGDVRFYAAGNAANFSFSTDGDFIFTTSVVVKAPSVNHPPTFATLANRIVGVGDRISFTVAATDQDNDPVTMSASALTNAAFDPASKRFTFTPAAHQVGTQQVTFTASDGQAQTQQTINLEVMAESSLALDGLTKSGASKYLDSSGATQIDLTVLGAFDAGAEIIFNGLPMTTQAVTGGLAASLPASELASAGAYVVRVKLGSGALTNARVLALAAAINAQTTATADAASYSLTVAPGQIVSLFGLDLVVGSGVAAASAIPLPRSLQSTTVYVNGIAAPLFFTSAGQINYQMPYRTQAGQASVVVLRDDGVAAYGVVDVIAAVPALFTLNQQGTGQAAALNQDFSLNSDPGVNPQAKRARKGEFIILFGSGTGAQLVASGSAPPQPLTINDGEAAGVNPLPATATAPAITIGGKAAPVGFSGLAPGFVGLWQLNVQIPTDAPSGASVEVIINLGGVDSRIVTIAIE
jgi:uncharacterized protein (TIGR03437 family)